MLKVTSGALIPKPARVGYYSWVTPRKETLAPMGGLCKTWPQASCRIGVRGCCMGWCISKSITRTSALVLLWASSNPPPSALPQSCHGCNVSTLKNLITVGEFWQLPVSSPLTHPVPKWKVPFSGFLIPSLPPLIRSDEGKNLSLVFTAASVVLSWKASPTSIIWALSSRQPEHGACITSRNMYYVCMCSWKESMIVFSSLS